MKYLFVILLSFLPSLAMSQEEGVESYVECAELLSSPPLDTLLTQNEGNDYGYMASDHIGVSLLGVECSRDQIVEYFSVVGWELRGEGEQYGVSGGPANRYKTDYNVAFCKLRKLPWRLIFYRCEAIVGFDFFEGRVTHINSGFNP